MNGRESEFRAGWRPLAAATIGTAFGASPIPFNVLPLAIGPIHEEMGWSFGAISAGVAIYGTLGAFLAPVYGALADRKGVRPVALLSLAAFGLVFACFALLPPSLPVFYALCVVLGSVVIGSTPVTWSRAVSLWFDRRRGLALGLMLLGTSLTGLTVPSLVRVTIENWGWRAAFPVVALLPLAVALPVGLLWFREPGRDTPAGAVARPDFGVNLKEAMRDWRFWMLGFSILVVALAYSGTYIHVGQMIALHGQSPATAAAAISTMAVGILVGRVAAGWLFDLVWAPFVVAPALALGALGYLLLMGTGSAIAPLFVATFLLGLSSGGETDAIAYMAARYFGLRAYGRIYGALYLIYGAASAISPFLYGAVRDATGRYDAILVAAAVAYLVGGAAMLTLGRYPDFGERRPG